MERAGRIPQSFIDELLARVDIVEVIDTRVPLKKTGRNFVARCPFHDEKTPSFTVSPHKQFYHCFGCGASGSAITFLMEYEHLTFPEAVEALAAQYGLKAPREIGSKQAVDEAKQRRLQALYRLNQEVAGFYARQLQSAEGRLAVDYLRWRGVDDEIARRYGLGYAPPGRETLGRYFDAELLEAAGLVIAKGEKKRPDRFRHRIMFPIRNLRGQVVGFGGRALDSRGPKYLNSPQTEIFNKGREVYGLYELFQVERRPSRIIVVEGYLDVIALAQYNIPYAVATLGTAVTAEHIQLLFRYVGELIFCFDGDAAGRKAAWRALEAVLPQLLPGRKVNFLWLPQGEDPDSLIRKEDAQAFIQRFSQAEPLSAYFFRALSDGLDLSQLEDRALLLKRARPLLDRLPESEFRRLIQKRLAELAGNLPVKMHVDQSKPTQPFLSLEERVAALLAHHPCMVERLPDQFLKAAQEGQYSPSLAQLVSILAEIDQPTPAVLLDKFQNSPHLAWLQKLLDQEEFQSIQEPQKELLDAIAALQQKNRKRRLKILTRKADTEGLSAEERAELRGLIANRELSLVNGVH